MREAALLGDIPINSPCGGQGKCGKCGVKINSEKELKLACQTKINKDTIVHMQKHGRAGVSRKGLVSSPGTIEGIPLKPVVIKKYLQIPKPTLNNPLSDKENIKKALGDKYSSIVFPLSLLREIPWKLRDSNFKVTAIITGNELLGLETGNTTTSHYGLAFDIGTTSIAGALIDLAAGRELGMASETNEQVVYGDDIISRINFSMSEKHGLEELQKKVISVINRIINKLIKAAKIKKNNIYGMTVVGNTTMKHLFLGIPPDSLALSPYVPAINKPVVIKAAELGIKINPCASVYTFSGIGGFVGGDTVGLLLASSLHKTKKTKLAIDLGTNGEVVLCHNGRLLAASTAAGPAFEGGHISRGMRAVKGAIEMVFISNNEVSVKVIGDCRPQGICGSGLIDAVAELIEQGIVDKQGRMRPEKELKNKVSDKLLKRITENKQGRSFVLTGKPNEIVITQKDIRELQLAKGAMQACISILMKEAGIKNKDIDELLIAGTFGNFIRRESIQAIKLLPGIASERINLIGNAALSGAIMSVISSDKAAEAENLAGTVEYIELSDRTDFQEEFVEALSF